MIFRSLISAAVLAASVSCAWASDISGAGATFPVPIYAKWADAYKKATGNGLNYQSIGSGGDRVEVTVSRTETEGSLIVRDFGRGIASEHLPRLTERFYRVDAGQSRAKNGTGLGLAIVKHILARHRGRLTISSRLDRGSTFTATAPLHPL